MAKRIVFCGDDGGVAIIIPSPEAVAIYGIEEIARKDVPAGRPFKIVDTVDIPADRTFRAAWAVDVADLTDGVGAPYEVFPEVGDSEKGAGA